MSVVSYDTEFGTVYRCIGCCKDDYANIETMKNYRKPSGVYPWRNRVQSISGQLPMLKAIRAVEKELGLEVVVTGSLRTCELQASLYRKDPKRYAAPSVGVHCQGLAIDVNTVWQDGLNNKNEDKFKAWMKHFGFRQSRPDDEPWHWSYFVVA